MKNPVLKGTVIIKLNAEEVQARRDAGAEDTAIIHEVLENIFWPRFIEGVTYRDCEIKESEEEALPF